MPKTPEEQMQAAQLARTMWKKGRNYDAALARVFLELKADFDPEAYGYSNFGGWLGLKAGLNDTQIIDLFKMFERHITGEARDAVNAELEAQASAKRQARIQKAREIAAMREAQAAVKQQRASDAQDKLIERAKHAADAVRAADKAQTIEGRRQINLEYGQALLALRQTEANKNRYHDLIVKHDLEARDAPFRSNAIWLAENWSDLVTSLSHCPVANPGDIRTWLREQESGASVGEQRTSAAGVGKIARAVRGHVRPLVEGGEPINVRQVAEATGHSRIVVEAAIAAERGRKEGLDEASSRHIPSSGPLMADEYETFSMALHEDLTNPAKRAMALALLVRKKDALLGETRPPVKLRVVE